MKKIPSLFKRNYDGDRLVYDEVVPGCEWVLDGQGISTRKWNGTSCMIKDGILYKRYDAKNGKIPPINFIPAQDFDKETGHWPGWVPVGNNMDEKWHIEAFNKLINSEISFQNGQTFELCGPKIQGNPEGFHEHILIPHPLPGDGCSHCPRDFHGIKEYLRDNKIEGIVFHHADGRMCKIKRKDFGFR